MSLRRVPRTVWAIAAGGALMDGSIGMILAVWPVHLTETLGATAFHVGLIEGVGDAITAVMILVGGIVSDRIGSRRRVLILGEGIGAATRLGYALGAASLPFLIAARFVDRFGRSVIGAPRNAIVGEVQNDAKGGAVGYGALYGVIALGAGVGPLAASAIVAAGGDFSIVAWATVPVAALGWSFYFLARDAPAPVPSSMAVPDSSTPLGNWRLMGPIIALGCLMNVAAVGWAFILLRGRSVGMSEESVAMLFAILCIAQGVGGIIGGRFAEALNPRRGLALAGTGMAVADGLLIVADAPAFAIAAVTVWGASWGVFNAVGTGVMFRATYPKRRAFAFGLISLVHTLPLFLSEPLYGRLIDAAGAAPAFAVGAGFALTLALVARLTIPSASR